MALTEQKKAQAKKWRDANKERRNAYQRAWNEKHPGYFKEYSKRYHSFYQSPNIEQLRERSLASYFKRTYGLTSEQINEMVSVQGNKCGICSIQFDISSKKTKPHVDHDHDTNVVRGLLCHRCNVGLGQFDDSIDTLLSAAAYLAKH